jgi:hypothetical protein
MLTGNFPHLDFRSGMDTFFARANARHGDYKTWREAAAGNLGNALAGQLGGMRPAKQVRSSGAYVRSGVRSLLPSRHFYGRRRSTPMQFSHRP